MPVTSRRRSDEPAADLRANRASVIGGRPGPGHGQRVRLAVHEAAHEERAVRETAVTTAGIDLGAEEQADDHGDIAFHERIMGGIVNTYSLMVLGKLTVSRLDDGGVRATWSRRLRRAPARSSPPGSWRCR